MPEHRRSVRDILWRFQATVLALFLTTAVLGLVVAAALRVEKFNVKELASSVLNEASVGVITGIVVLAAFEYFTRLRQQEENLPGRLERILTEQLPPSFAKRLSRHLASIEIVELDRRVSMTFSHVREGSAPSVRIDIHTVVNLQNVSKQRVSWPVQIHSHDLKHPSNQHQIHKDGVYQVKDFVVTVGRRAVLDTRTIDKALVPSRVRAASVATEPEAEGDGFWMYQPQLMLKKNQRAQVETWTYRLCPVTSGYVRAHAGSLGQRLEVALEAAEVRLLEQIAISAKATWADSETSGINLTKSGYARTIELSGLLLPFEGVVLRWALTASDLSQVPASRDSHESLPSTDTQVDVSAENAYGHRRDDQSSGQSMRGS